MESVSIGRLAGLLGLLLISTWLLPNRVEALGIGPLSLENVTGHLDLSNSSNRLIKVEIQVFPLRIVNGKPTAGITAIDAEKAELIVRIRPQYFRLGPKGSRHISYRILHAHEPFYICGISRNGLLVLRVCSRWPGLK